MAFLRSRAACRCDRWHMHGSISRQMSIRPNGVRGDGGRGAAWPDGERFLRRCLLRVSMPQAHEGVKAAVRLACDSDAILHRFYWKGKGAG